MSNLNPEDRGPGPAILRTPDETRSRRPIRPEIYALALTFVICLTNAAFGQECPFEASASRVRTLEGQVVFHDGIRRWLELKLDRPQCGQTSVQLVTIEHNTIPLVTFRGCRIKSTGPIDFSQTGYYSLDTFQDVQSVEAAGACSRQPPLPDYSGARPDKSIQAYRVEMHVDYRPGDHPIIFHVWNGARELLPWQAYADYWLTGGYVLYGHCGKGFIVDEVSGPQETSPMHFDSRGAPDDMAEFNPENAARSGKQDLQLGYTCIREPLQKRSRNTG